MPRGTPQPHPLSKVSLTLPRASCPGPPLDHLQLPTPASAHGRPYSGGRLRFFTLHRRRRPPAANRRRPRATNSTPCHRCGNQDHHGSLSWREATIVPPPSRSNATAQARSRHRARLSTKFPPHALRSPPSSGQGDTTTPHPVTGPTHHTRRADDDAPPHLIYRFTSALVRARRSSAEAPTHTDRRPVPSTHACRRTSHDDNARASTRTVTRRRSPARSASRR